MLVDVVNHSALIGVASRLEPLKLEHFKQLALIGLDPELWQLQPRAIVNEQDMFHYVQSALSDKAAGFSLPYVVVHQSSNDIVGSTRFMDIALVHRRLEIGATWLCKNAQRTGINPEIKFLMLREAFEGLNVNKVVFKTDVLNVQSRTALHKIGAKEEGVFREHFIADSGRVRSMVYFSILHCEWPSIKHLLQRRLKEVHGIHQ